MTVTEEQKSYQTKCIWKEYENLNRCLRIKKKTSCCVKLFTSWSQTEPENPNREWGIYSLGSRGISEPDAVFMGLQIHEHREVRQRCLRLNQPIILWLDTSHLHGCHTCGNHLLLKPLPVMCSSCMQAPSLNETFQNNGNFLNLNCDRNKQK